MACVRLGDCCEIVAGATPSTTEGRYWGGDIAWATPKDLSDLESKYISVTNQTLTSDGYSSCSTKLMPVNSVLFSSRAPIGHVAINSIPMCTNQGFKSFVPDPDRVSPDYLYHWLKANKAYLQSLGNGATFKEVSKAVVSDIKIPLPSLVEQRRIAAILDKADALRAKRREAIAKFHTLLQSTFMAMFGDPAANPKGWVRRELGELCDPTDRVNYGVVQPGDDFSGGVPLIRVGDIDGGVLNGSSIKRIDPSIEKAYGRSRLAGNELLISCVGSIGTIALVPASAKGYNIARAITRIPLMRPDERPFVRECLRTPALQRYFSEKTRTVSQPTLNVSFVKSAPVICPPEALVKRFCDVAEAIERNIQAMFRFEDGTNKLFVALQERAFPAK